MRVILLIFILLAVVPSAFAQEKGIDCSKMEAGITVGINQALLQPSFSPMELQSNDVLSISKEQNPGISMGLSASYAISQVFKIRGAATFNVYDGRLKYQLQSAGSNFIRTHVEKTWASSLELPIHLLTTPFDVKYQPTIVTGPRYGYNLQKAGKQQQLNYTRHHLGWDVGLATTFSTKYFDISPQITYTAGLTQLASLGHGTVAGSVESLQRDVIRFAVFLH